MLNPNPSAAATSNYSFAIPESAMDFGLSGRFSISANSMAPRLCQASVAPEQAALSKYTFC